MTDLAIKYRPRRFSEIVGQDSLVTWMREQIRSGGGRSVLVAGPVGTGKTTSGLIYAKALLCGSPVGGEACGVCDQCQEFGENPRNVPSFHALECGEHSTVDEVKDLLEKAKVAPFLAPRRVLMLDEVHNLSRRASDALLRILEAPPEWTSFILLTYRLNLISGALRSRLSSFELSALNEAEAFRLLAGVCDREGLTFDQEGFRLIFKAASGGPREMLRAVEKTSQFGPVDGIHVRLALNLNFEDRLTAFTRALMAGDLEGQLSAVEEWPDTAERKLDFLHQFFVFQYFDGCRRLRREDPLMRNVGAETQEQLVAAFAARAAASGREPEAYWESIIDALTSNAKVTDHSLAMILGRVNRLFNPVPPIRAEVGKPRAETAKPVLRVRSSASSSGDRTFLPWAEIRPHWQAASLLPQRYGVLFNLRLTISRSGSDRINPEGNAQLVSKLTHELGMRLKDWCGSSSPVLHWMYRHEREDETRQRTRVLLSVPDEHVAAALAWLRAKFVPRMSRTCHLKVQIACRPGMPQEDRVRFHWQGVRALSRSLDPRFTARSGLGSVSPLVDLLKIPLRWRAQVRRMSNVQARGMSASLTGGAKRNDESGMACLSALSDGAWQAVDTGWELPEYEARKAERERREVALARLAALLPGADDARRESLHLEMELLKSSWSSDPRDWRRGWSGWWLPETRVKLG
ncbi:AAA family ATPase [Bradyrhizobium diazoefficiens]|uniref:DNA polymerase III subunit n=1 Tax=Bradyrhizobium diazoefficiens TaxID=1355477 RepID=UPI001B8CC928|nr:AAA family ATPase [Bradyrhizobium diazoefficiens]MBR0866302.1 AAA family ATPase [Bradyrhizobium diazoefficiens]MBR0890763.1 AAA family ATPase [Bradyrhizobium diazoefficiens]MBR0922596.1 AAA family ATPase [Bradyrhizobium diazoefficiens]